MPVNSNLSVGNLVQVGINLSPLAAQSQNLSIDLVLGNSAVINTVERMRTYTSATAMLTDGFSSTSPEYLSAVLWFEQAPQPSSLNVGRWAQTVTAGQLICGPLAAAQLALSYWTALGAASFDINVNGSGVTPINFSSGAFSTATALSGVASVIQTAVDAAESDLATVVYDPVYTRFEFTSPTTGTTSSVSFLTAGTTGTDISTKLVGTNLAGNGAYVVPGVAAESALAAVTLFDTQFGQQWYGLQMPSISTDADTLSVAAFIEASTQNKHIFGDTTQEGAVINGNDSSSIAYQLKQLGYNRTATQYSSTNPYAVASLFARILTVDYTANNSTITLAYKQEPGITAENLNQTQFQNVVADNCNAFLAFNNNTAIIWPGVMASGMYIDVITGVDNFAVTLQTAIYNALYLTPTKIPQTDPGVHSIVTVIEAVCSQFVQNGFIAPGTWTVGGFGSLKQGQFMPTGYYVYVPPLASQTTAQRASRKTPPIQVAIKLAGAIQDVNVIVNVNQ